MLRSYLIVGLSGAVLNVFWFIWCCMLCVFVYLVQYAVCFCLSGAVCGVFWFLDLDGCY